MVFIKYLFTLIIGVGLFILSLFGSDSSNTAIKGGTILAFVIGLFVVNLLARVAWKLIALLLVVGVVVYLLKVAGLVEIKLPSNPAIRSTMQISETK